MDTTIALATAARVVVGSKSSLTAAGRQYSDGYVAAPGERGRQNKRPVWQSGVDTRPLASRLVPASRGSSVPKVYPGNAELWQCKPGMLLLNQPCTTRRKTAGTALVSSPSQARR